MASFEDVMPTAADLDLALLGRSVATTDRAVAILVSGRAVQRSSWSDEVEVSETDFDRLLTEKPPPPDVDDLNGAKFRTLDPKSRAAQRRRCSACQFALQNNRCLRCSGTGRVATSGNETEKCSACDDGVARPCAVCGGTRRSVTVKIVFGEDVVRHFAHIFLPELPAPMQEPLSRFFKSRGAVPDVLSIDLADDFAAADAYRGRRSRAEVRGHRADSALALARTYAERVTRLPTMAAVRVAAFAWPLVIGSYAGDVDPAFVVVKDELGSVCLLP